MAHQCARWPLKGSYEVKWCFHQLEFLSPEQHILPKQENLAMEVLSDDLLYRT